jgi:hypothetical protein
MSGVGTRSLRPARHPPDADALSRTTRVLLLVFTVLTAVAFNQLFVLAEHTDTWFSWTINPPLTAAFLGGSYAAGFVLVVLSLRGGAWSQARLPIVTVLIFAILTLVATLAHLDKFHFEAPGAVARFAAWFWLAVYLVVPVALALAVVRQQSVAGPSTRRRPVPAGLRWGLAVQGLLMLAVGATLFVTPGSAATLWAWTLTPLTARVVAAWLIAFGAAALLALREPDFARLQLSFIGYTVLASLQFLALALWGQQVTWGSAASTIYVIELAGALAIGVTGWSMSARLPA